MAPYGAVALERSTKSAKAESRKASRRWRRVVRRWRAARATPTRPPPRAPAHCGQLLPACRNVLLHREAFVVRGAKTESAERPSMPSTPARARYEHRPSRCRTKTALPALFMKPGASGRAPTVVVFDGMDNCKEMSVRSGARVRARGWNTLAIDGPGRASRCAFRAPCPLRLRNPRHGATIRRRAARGRSAEVVIMATASAVITPPASPVRKRYCAGWP